MTDADLQQALRDCFDPMRKRNIVELGMVRAARLELDSDAPGIGVGPRYVARVTISAPGTDEAVNAQLEAQVSNRLAGIAEISRSEITMLPALFPILR